jgi:thymidine kinase
MFSGKTEELIRRLKRARIARQRVLVFKPKIDVRYGKEEVVSHTDVRIECVPVSDASDILGLVGDAQVVGIDEAQFFDDNLVPVVEQLADEGIRVVVAGLDLDYRGQPFGPIPQLLAVAEYLTKTLAVCTVCGAPANRSQRLVHRDSRVLLGASESYEARCRRHWEPGVFDPHQESLPLGG